MAQCTAEFQPHLNAGLVYFCILGEEHSGQQHFSPYVPYGARGWRVPEKRPPRRSPKSRRATR